MNALDLVTRILLVVGGLNWGLVGVANFDLVATLFGAGALISNIVYTLVGVSAIVQGIRLFTAKHATGNGRTAHAS